MSTSFLDVLREFDAAVTEAGASLAMRSDPPATGRKSTKASAGMGSKVIVAQPELRFNHVGGKPEHGNSLTTGTLSFVLYPSNASDEVTIDSASLLLEVGNQIVLLFDGRASIRATTTSTAYRRDGKVEIVATLSLPLVCQASSTPSPLAGRV